MEQLFQITIKYFKEVLRKFVLAIVLFIVLLFSDLTFAQRRQDVVKLARHSLYFELFGNGGWYSFNYDNLIFSKNGFKMSARVGLSYYLPFTYNNLTAVSAPVELNFFYGRKSNVEIGLGCTSLLSNGFYLTPMIRVGYRYQDPDGGIFIRAGILFVLLNNNFSEQFTFQSVDRYSMGKKIPPKLPRIGLSLFSIGYTFKNKKP